MTTQNFNKKAKHTPGPWAFNKTERGEFIVFDERRPPLERVICHTGTAFSHDNANARLIAAAPELLQALKDIIDIGMGGRLEDIALNAIAKAEGSN